MPITLNQGADRVERGGDQRPGRVAEHVPADPVHEHAGQAAQGDQRQAQGQRVLRQPGHRVDGRLQVLLQRAAVLLAGVEDVPVAGEDAPDHDPGGRLVGVELHHRADQVRHPRGRGDQHRRGHQPGQQGAAARRRRCGPWWSSDRQHQRPQQPVGVRVRVLGEPGVHRPRLHHRAARRGQPAEPLAQVLPGRRPGVRVAAADVRRRLQRPVAPTAASASGSSARSRSSSSQTREPR